jgi:hypothetical protein
MINLRYAALGMYGNPNAQRIGIGLDGLGP